MSESFKQYFKSIGPCAHIHRIEFSVANIREDESTDRFYVIYTPSHFTLERLFTELASWAEFDLNTARFEHLGAQLVPSQQRISEIPDLVNDKDEAVKIVSVYVDPELAFQEAPACRGQEETAAPEGTQRVTSTTPTES
jgi:hypothetical protein